MASVRAVACALCGFALASSAFSAAVNKTDTYLNRLGVAYVQTHQAPAGRVKRGAYLRDLPGEDKEPYGFPIYDSIKDIPPYRVTSEDALHAKCYKREQVCLNGAFCGYVCEQVSSLMTVFFNAGDALCFMLRAVHVLMRFSCTFVVLYPYSRYCWPFRAFALRR